MEDERAWEMPIWKMRFAAYTPLMLARFIQNTPEDAVHKLACEELDRQLVAIGCVPRG